MAFIGKNVIENLTTAMYEDLRIIYREYIQNAADSIDKAIAQSLITPEEARIDIEIDVKQCTITVVDNGIGICCANFKEVMSRIAHSDKDRSEEKGFRGIGRLGGISSCKTLRFSCSAPGENCVSVCTWDAKEVQAILVDSERNPSAAELVDMTTEYSSDVYDTDAHFFKVEMLDVEKNALELLDVDGVIEYLQAVAPVPYAVGFLFAKRIKDYARENGFRIDEYQVFVNGERLFKPYTTNLYEPKNSYKQKYDALLDVKFEKFTDSAGDVLAWMWYGVCKFEKQIPPINPMRGIRLRKGNIQIGNENTFASHDFYDEVRGGLYFVGEVFAVSADLIPNARRDYFNLNTTCRTFEKELRPLFHDKFKKIYHYANDYKKALQKQQDLVTSQEEYQRKIETGGFLDAEDMQKAEEAIKEKQKLAEKASKQIVNRDSKEKDDDVLGKVYTALRKEYPVQREQPEVRPKQEAKPAKGKQYITQSLSKYNKSEQKLIGHIYGILKAILPRDTATMVINKIQEELSK